MMQAIIHLTLLLSLLWFPFSLLADPKLSERTCKESEWALSHAYQDQADAIQALNQRKKEVAQELFRSSLVHFGFYHKCLESENQKPSELTSYATAISHTELGEWEEAFEWNLKAYQVPDPSRESILLKSRLEIRKGQPLEAIETLENNLHSYPNDSDMLYLLGSLANETRNPSKSILYFTSLYDSILRKDGNARYKTITIKMLGDLYFRVNQPKRSLFFYLAHLQTNPNDYEALFRISQIYYFLGDFGLSKKYLNTLREKNSRDVESSHLLAEMYFLDARIASYSYFQELSRENKIPETGIISLLFRHLQGERESLLPEIRSFLEKNPSRLSARVVYQDSLSEKQSKLERFQALIGTADLAFGYRQYWIALDALQRAIQVSQDDPALAVDIPVLYERISRCEEELGKPNKALLSIRKALALSIGKPVENGVRLRLAYLLLNEQIRKIDQAEKEVLELNKKEPNNGQFAFLLGLVYFQKNDYQRSLQAFSRAIEIEQENANSYFYRALVYDKLGRFSELESDLYRAIALNPESANAYNYLGYLYTERNTNLEKAKELIAKAVTLEPDNGAYQDSLGWIYYKLEEWEEADLHLKLAETLLKDRGMEDPVVLEHIGDLYLKKEDRINAISYWERALKISKNPDESNRIQAKKKEATLWLQK